jgi:hypothetical protein
LRRPEAVEEQAAEPAADAGHAGQSNMGEKVVIDDGSVGHRSLPEEVNECTVLHPHA